MQRKVLIVDDEISSLHFLKRSLEREGMMVIFAEDGEEAKKKILKNTPDVVILDLVMPRLNGWETLHWIRKEAKLEIPVIILSARREISEVKKGYNLEADHYLTKPINPPELIQAINLVCSIKAQ